MSAPSVEARLRHPLSRVCLAPLCTSPSFLQSNATGGRVSGGTGTACCLRYDKKKTGAKAEPGLRLIWETFKPASSKPHTGAELLRCRIGAAKRHPLLSLNRL